MEYHEQLQTLTKKREELAQRYYDERTKYGQMKSDIDVIYASEIKAISDIKKNCGYETGLLLLIALKPALRDSYKAMVQGLNNYKALQRLIDSVESKIMAVQSIMRYNRSND